MTRSWSGLSGDAAGSLSEYGRNVKPGMTIKQMKDRAREEADP